MSKYSINGFRFTRIRKRKNKDIFFEIIAVVIGFSFLFFKYIIPILSTRSKKKLLFPLTQGYLLLKA